MQEDSPICINDILENMPNAFYTVDAQWRLTYINQKAEEWWQRSRGDILGTVLWDTFPDLKKTIDRQMYHKAVNEQIPVNWETFLPNLKIWLEVAACPLSKGGLAVYLSDITEQKTAEIEKERLTKLINKQITRMDTLMESLPVGVWIADADGKLIMTNKAAAQIYGGSAPLVDRVDEYTVYKIYSPDTGEQIPVEGYPLVRAINGETVTDMVMDHVRFNGERGTHIGSSIPIRDENRGITGAVVVAMDITKLREAEKALRESEKKALDLINKLEKADQNKNQFISSLSHELRNPLASMMMSLSLLKLADPDSEQAFEARGIFERQTLQLSRLVDDLLEVTRITQNKIKLKKELVELNDLTLKTIKDYIQMFAEKGVSLEFNGFPQPIYLQADQTRLTQVIGNLLHNAYKFTDKDGKIQVTLSKDEKSKQVIIKVIDNGLGIKPEHLQNLFKPFVQADASLDRSGGGLGLGLAIVKGMVELHDGSVTVYSDGLGKGSEFIIRLPLLMGEESKQVIKSHDNNKVTSARRILVIDDIKDVAEVICSLLRHLGHEVISAPDGIKGISVAKDFKPDVIFCDIGLPGMNGYEVARIIRKDDQLKDIYLIAISGYAQGEDLKKSREAGFNCHFAKPVDFAELEEVLNRNGVTHQDIGAK